MPMYHIHKAKMSLTHWVKLNAKNPSSLPKWQRWFFLPNNIRGGKREREREPIRNENPKRKRGEKEKEGILFLYVQKDSEDKLCEDVHVSEAQVVKLHARLKWSLLVPGSACPPGSCGPLFVALLS